jgi:hypothetical protein
MSCYGSDLIDGFVLLVGTSDDFASPVNFGNPLEIPVGVMRDDRLFRPVAPGLGRAIKGEREGADPLGCLLESCCRQKSLV